ncbi:hypothetical protein [Streptomyces sp. NPDC059092]|uniref:hypothetical protein n=1 Tax=Streptomyces sp. NPDC059092 TaxID=3346725 RepID=UPI0036A83284
MQRTRNVVMVLVGVAVTAASGCVAVGPRPAQEIRPAPPAAAPSTGPGGAEPHVVQAPVEEALERIAPTRGVVPDASPGARRPAPGHGAGGRPASAERSPAPSSPGLREQPREAAHERSVPRLPATLPSVPTLTEVCAFGEGYGRWPADSPQARICRGTHGD